MDSSELLICPAHIRAQGLEWVKKGDLDMGSRVREYNEDLRLHHDPQLGGYIVIYTNPITGQKVVVHEAEHCDERIIQALYNKDTHKHGWNWDAWNERREAELERRRQAQYEIDVENATQTVFALERAGLRPKSRIFMNGPVKKDRGRRVILPGGKK